MSANSTLDSNGLTKALVERCRGLTAAGIPDDASIVARQCLLDWLGVTLAGSREPLTAILRDEALAEGGHPRATLVGSGERVSLQQAALINGAASHALDFDDVQMAMIGHPTVPVLPALLALGEEANEVGRQGAVEHPLMQSLRQITLVLNRLQPLIAMPNARGFQLQQIQLGQVVERSHDALPG